MAQQPVDPNDVLMTGENSFVRLSADGGKAHSSRASHWRVLWCAAVERVPCVVGNVGEAARERRSTM